MNDNREDDYEQLADELQNFSQIARLLKPSPREMPRIEGIDIAGLSMPLKEVIGGDHTIYIDFNARYDLDLRMARARAEGKPEVAKKLAQLKHRAGILLADVSGHRMTDALVGAMLHQAFLLGAYYELDQYGEITTRIFEQLNTRFYRTTAVNKFFTMIYGEISSEGRFRFISAGHHPPTIFSREFGRFVELCADRLVSFPPVGLLPTDNDADESSDFEMLSKKRYSVNEIDLLAAGDVLLLLTDGLAEHDEGRFFPDAVQTLLATCTGCTSAEICARLESAILERAAPEDDISVVAIRRTR